VHLEERKREQQHHSILFPSLQLFFWIFLLSVQSPLASQLWAVKQRFSSMLDSASPIVTNHTAGILAQGGYCTCPYTKTRNATVDAKHLIKNSLGFVKLKESQGCGRIASINHQHPNHPIRVALVCACDA
jgi:hypothetical protein